MDGVQTAIPIYTPKAFPWEQIEEIMRGPLVAKPGNNAGVKTGTVNLVTAFDIETTRLEDIEQSIMYIWQWGFEGIGVVVGRTWTEWLEFAKKLNKKIKRGRLLCFVHNLSYEFQWLRALLPLSIRDVFVVENRGVLKFRWEKIEFRCSQLLSGYRLKTWCEVRKNEHPKLDDFVYTEKRFPWTVLTDREMEYCVTDVIAVCECVRLEMAARGDNLGSLPLTKTGFVRRAAKRAMHDAGRGYLDQLPDLETYKLLRKAFRGGNTHANRYEAGYIIDNVQSWDRSSSYPDVIVNDLFPMHRFYRRDNDAKEFLYRLNKGEAILARLHFTGIRLRTDRRVSVPYLTIDKLEYFTSLGAYDKDNGRLLGAENGSTDITLVLTDIDFRIISNQYEWKAFEVLDMMSTLYGPIPRQVRDLVKSYYQNKTAWKDLPGYEAVYQNVKADNNSIYGLFAQDPLKDEIIFDFDNPDVKKNGGYVLDESKSMEARIETYQRTGTLPYQWGVWTTCWARYWLQRAIDLVDSTPDATFVYCDTDSVKFAGNVDFTQLNDELRNRSIESGAFADDKNGHRHYMGVFENEKTADRFITWGAKKYAYEINRKINVTISGVPKEEAAAYISKVGGLDRFNRDWGNKNILVFPAEAINKLEAVYNDKVCMPVEIDGHKIMIIDNVVLRPVNYSLGITDDYMKLLENLAIRFDFPIDELETID